MTNNQERLTSQLTWTWSTGWNKWQTSQKFNRSGKWQSRRTYTQFLLQEHQNCNQPSTEGYWNPQKKKPHAQGQRWSCKKTVGGTQSSLKSNLLPTRNSWRAQAKPCVYQDPGKEAVSPTRDWARPAVSVWGSSVEAWVSNGLPQGQGHWQQQFWKAWHVA